MAKNEVYEDGEQIAVTLAAKVSGQAVVFGQVPGVCLNNTDTDGKVTITTKGVYTIPVLGTVAVVAGDILYLSAGGVLSKTNTDVRFGYALDAVPSGTVTIRVKLGY